MWLSGTFERIRRCNTFFTLIGVWAEKAENAYMPRVWAVWEWLRSTLVCVGMCLRARGVQAATMVWFPYEITNPAAICFCVCRMLCHLS